MWKERGRLPSQAAEELGVLSGKAAAGPASGAGEARYFSPHFKRSIVNTLFYNLLSFFPPNIPSRYLGDHSISVQGEYPCSWAGKGQDWAEWTQKVSREPWAGRIGSMA